MFTRPADLTDADVRAALVRDWALDVVAVEHALVGFGSHHWWVTTADGCRWFATADDLRLRRRTDDEGLAAPFQRLRAALTTATALRERGLDWVVAPRRAGSGGVVEPLGEAYALAVYPAVEGTGFGWGPFEDTGHGTAVLDRLAELHGLDGCRDTAGVDDLGAAVVAGLGALLSDPGERWESGPFGPDAWRLVVERGDVLTDRPSTRGCSRRSGCGGTSPISRPACATCGHRTATTRTAAPPGPPCTGCTTRQPPRRECGSGRPGNHVRTRAVFNQRVDNGANRDLSS